NEVLHDYRDLIICRQGIPYRDKGVSVITVVIDALSESINSLSGKLGMIKGVKSKVLTTK
ncbi:MAG: iron-only hydrogenase system regulator, partial [Firmicutes bacterium]|nr:iron-only hydrogenase system regulator [Candidatus Caballimonas caccae]